MATINPSPLPDDLVECVPPWWAGPIRGRMIEEGRRGRITYMDVDHHEFSSRIAYWRECGFI